MALGSDEEGNYKFNLIREKNECVVYKGNYKEKLIGKVM